MYVFFLFFFYNGSFSVHSLFVFQAQLKAEMDEFMFLYLVIFSEFAAFLFLKCCTCAVKLICFAQFACSLSVLFFFSPKG